MNEPRRPPLAERLMKSLQEGIEFARGERDDLVVTVIPSTRPYTGEEVAAIRARRKMSQIQFAHMLGVSVKTLQSWEQGVRKPSKPTMRLLQIFDQPEAFQSILMVREPAKEYDKAPVKPKKKPKS